MKKKFACILILLILIVACIGAVGYKVRLMRNEMLIAEQSRAVTEQPIVEEVSRRSGIKFEDMASIREYVYCGDLLQKGMSQQEAAKALAKIGEIEPIGSGNETVVFKNRVLNKNLSVLILVFNNAGKLAEWGASTEIPPFGIHRGSCE
jgi:hypothetical protein